jgi:hypothetical protein
MKTSYSWKLLPYLGVIWMWLSRRYGPDIDHSGEPMGQQGSEAARRRGRIEHA